MNTKHFRITIAAVFLLLASFQTVKAQEVVWGANFDFFFDNREYKSSINWPQSIFGARLAPEVGVRWDNRHSLMFGINLLANFGDKPFMKDNEMFAYYQYSSPKFKAWAGIVPRQNLIGEYSGAFFSDSIKYFDPYISGLLLQYVGDRGYVEFACDWNSKLSDTKREKFMLLSAGRINAGIFYGGYHFSMYHHAGTFTEDGVVDNVLVYPHVGVHFGEFTNMQAFDLQVGWMNAFQNDRKYVGEYVTPGGVQVELRLEKWNFGIHNTFYAGKSLMPYYMTDRPNMDYGSGLYWGEPFYRTGNIYNRAELYWQPVHTEKMNLKVSTVHHYDGKIWNWQQKIIFSVNLGQNRLFKKPA